MKTYFICIVTVLLLTFITCSRGEDGFPESADPEKNTRNGDTLMVSLHDTLRLSGNLKYITFDTLYSDSRCPRNVSCIWEGAFEVGVSLCIGDQVDRVRLGTYPGQKADSVLQGIEIKLIDLLPYPVSGNTAAGSDAEIRIGVFR